MVPGAVDKPFAMPVANKYYYDDFLIRHIGEQFCRDYVFLCLCLIVFVCVCTCLCARVCECGCGRGGGGGGGGGGSGMGEVTRYLSLLTYSGNLANKHKP